MNIEEEFTEVTNKTKNIFEEVIYQLENLQEQINDLEERITKLATENYIRNNNY